MDSAYIFYVKNKFIKNKSIKNISIKPSSGNCNWTSTTMKMAEKNLKPNEWHSAKMRKKRHKNVEFITHFITFLFVDIIN